MFSEPDVPIVSAVCVGIDSIILIAGVASMPFACLGDVVSTGKSDAVSSLPFISVVESRSKQIRCEDFKQALNSIVPYLRRDKYFEL